MHNKLSKPQLLSLLYHDIFDYPLTTKEIIKWQVGPVIQTFSVKKYPRIKIHQNYLVLQNKRHVVSKRIRRRTYSHRKILIAKKAAAVLNFIPSIQFVGITGSVAMMNAKKGSDVDLMIITSKNTLWISRFLAYLILKMTGFSVRTPHDHGEKDKLCLNLWIDESALHIEAKNQNLYTAHEIAQINPLVNKNSSYEDFLYQNRWVLKYWPNVVKVKVVKRHTTSSMWSFLEPFARSIQFFYMRKNRTREVVSDKKAFFHPFDWGQQVFDELEKRGVQRHT